MIFFVVNIDNYGLFLGLDFLIKTRTIVDVEKGVIQLCNRPGMEVEVLPLNVMNMLQVLKRSEEEKCDIQEKLFHKEMGQFQINNWANLLGSLNFDDFNDEMSFEEDITKYEGNVEDDPQEILLNLENQIEELKDHRMDLIIEEETSMQIMNYKNNIKTFLKGCFMRMMIMLIG